MKTTTTHESLGQLAESQSVLTIRMRRALEVNGPDVEVEVVRQHTAFGTFVIDWHIVNGGK